MLWVGVFEFPASGLEFQGFRVSRGCRDGAADAEHGGRSASVLITRLPSCADLLAGADMAVVQKSRIAFRCTLS